MRIEQNARREKVLVQNTESSCRVDECHYGQTDGAVLCLPFLNTSINNNVQDPLGVLLVVLCAYRVL